jgi:hypothetical protein
VSSSHSKSTARRCASPQASPPFTQPPTPPPGAHPPRPVGVFECLLCQWVLLYFVCVCVCVDKVSVALPCAPPPLDASGGVAGGHPHVVTTIIFLACVVSLSSCSSAAPLPARSLPFVLRYGGSCVCLPGGRLSPGLRAQPPSQRCACVQRASGGAEICACSSVCGLTHPVPCSLPPARLPACQPLFPVFGWRLISCHTPTFSVRSGNGFAPPPPSLLTSTPHAHLLALSGCAASALSA